MWPTSNAPLHLRVFISSPGDVADERNLARQLLKDELPYRPFVRDHITFDVVSWDDPAAPTPMPATLTPQEAVNRGRPKPSECNFVVVILWSRLGTPLPSEYRKPSGEVYLSGTEWEFEDAYNAPSQPTILVYHRKGAPAVLLDDSAYEEKRRQYELVRQFLARFTNQDGSIRISVTSYETPTDFKNCLASDLEELIKRCLEVNGHVVERSTGSNLRYQTQPSWKGSPYPGLRPFDFTEAAIFFGRGREMP